MASPNSDGTLDARKADLGDGVTISYATAGKHHPSKAILLVHGYPQTAYAMRFLLPLFAKAGYFAVAPDYRGAGGSSMPADGYDKMTLATDLHRLMTEVLDVNSYAVLGHDIGSMVATAQALKFRHHVTALIMMECPQPGTSAYHEFTTDPDITYRLCFHFFFHNCPDLPESLTHGKEAEYIQHFYDRLAYKPNFLSRHDRQVYYDSFTQPGRMRAGFGVYRAFRQDDKDAKDNIAAHGKLSIPVLATGGSHSLFTQYIEGMARELADNVSFASISEASHWVPEENPESLAEASVKFLQSST